MTKNRQYHFVKWRKASCETTAKEVHLSSNVIGFFSIEAEVRTTQNERLGHRQIALDREDAIVDHLAMVIWEEDKTTQSNNFGGRMAPCSSPLPSPAPIVVLCSPHLSFLR